VSTTTGECGAIVIDIWLPSYPAVPSYVAGMRELADRFHETHPGYLINIRESSYKTLPEDVFHAAQSGRPPALVQYFHTSSQLARDMLTADGRPLFTPVWQALGERTSVLGEPVRTAELLSAAASYYTDSTGLLAMPPLASTTLLYANTTLLARAGVTELPQTWAEVTAACAAVAALTDGPAHGITWPNHGWIFQQAIAQQGGLLADRDNGRAGRAERVFLASAEMLEFVRWWRELHRRGLYLYAGGRAYGENTARAWEENFRAFVDQRVAFILSSSVEAQWLVDAATERGFTVAASRMPHNGEVRYAGNVVGGDALWLVDEPDAAVRDGALAFLQYLFAPEQAAARHRSTWFTPITTGAVGLLEREGWFDRNPQHRAAVAQLSAGDGSPAARGAFLGEFARIQGLMTEAMEDVLVNDADPVRRFTAATTEAQRLLDEYNDHCLGRVPGPRGPRRFTVD
jgi:sn-glycerol 3-phosphate transport system substrate-binding protein